MQKSKTNYEAMIRKRVAERKATTGVSLSEYSPCLEAEKEIIEKVKPSKWYKFWEW